MQCCCLGAGGAELASVLTPSLSITTLSWQVQKCMTMELSAFVLSPSRMTEEAECLDYVPVRAKASTGQDQNSSQGKAGTAQRPTKGRGRGMKGRSATARLMPEGNVCPVQNSSKGTGPYSVLLLLPTAWPGEMGGIEEKGRDGTEQRTLGQGVWEDNSMLAKRKANTKYLIGILLLLNAFVRQDFSP